MKQLMCLLLLSFVLVFTHVEADIVTVPPTRIQAQLTNLTEFPEVVIVEYFEGAVPAEKYKIIQGNTFSMSPLSNKQVSFYVLKKEYLEKVGLDNINWSTDKNVQRLNVVTGSALSPEKHYIAFTYNAASEQYSAIDVYLKLAKKNNTYYVYKSKVTGKLRTNSSQQTPPDIVKNYKDDVVDTTEPILISGNIL